jgi:hypothetical protein
MFADTKCDENDVRRLDPKNAILSPELHALFLQARERVLLDPDSDPLTKQKARLIALSEDFLFHRSNNELAVARTVLKQIAEETGAIGKSAGAKLPVDPTEDPIGSITRTVVFPETREEVPNEQPEPTETEPAGQ